MGVRRESLLEKISSELEFGRMAKGSSEQWFSKGVPRSRASASSRNSQERQMANILQFEVY
jgi:hypothetical protein